MFLGYNVGDKAFRSFRFAPLGSEHMKDQRITGTMAENPRSEHDRRAGDFQRSPWEFERRHRVERRLPIIVEESAVSFSDWVRSMVIFLAKKRERAKAKSIAKRARPRRS